jgi:acyl carrier protein
VSKEVIDLIISTAGELGEDEIGSAGDLDADTVLFGRNGVLDSMGLVTLVIAVEQAIEDHYGRSIGLADEKAMSQTTSPYRTVRTLAEYASSLLKSG